MNGASAVSKTKKLVEKDDPFTREDEVPAHTHTNQDVKTISGQDQLYKKARQKSTIFNRLENLQVSKDSSSGFRTVSPVQPNGVAANESASESTSNSKTKSISEQRGRGRGKRKVLAHGKNTQS